MQNSDSDSYQASSRVRGSSHSEAQRQLMARGSRRGTSELKTVPVSNIKVKAKAKVKSRRQGLKDLRGRP